MTLPKKSSQTCETVVATCDGTLWVCVREGVGYRGPPDLKNELKSVKMHADCRCIPSCRCYGLKEKVSEWGNEVSKEAALIKS